MTLSLETIINVEETDWVIDWFRPRQTACRILVPRPAIEPRPQTVEAQSPQPGNSLKAQILNLHNNLTLIYWAFPVNSPDSSPTTSSFLFSWRWYLRRGLPRCLTCMSEGKIFPPKHYYLYFFDVRVKLDLPFVWSWDFVCNPLVHQRTVPGQARPVCPSMETEADQTAGVTRKLGAELSPGHWKERCSYASLWPFCALLGLSVKTPKCFLLPKNLNSESPGSWHS